jgi:hypothetical protein
MAGGISEEAIRERAYRIWEREGRPQGRDQTHWLRAKDELESETSTDHREGAATPPTAKRRRTATAKRAARQRSAC